MATLTDRMLDMPLPYEQSPYEPQPPYDFPLYPPFDTYRELLSQEAISAVHHPHHTYAAVDQSPQTPPHPSTHDVSGDFTHIVSTGVDSHFTFSGTCGLPDGLTVLKAPHVLDIPSTSTHPPPPPSAEFPPSIISWVSGASIASAASSTLGSPSSGASNTFPRSDPWAPADIHGLGIDPFHHHEGLVSTGFGAELTFANDKCPTGFVGECANVSSSSAATNPVPSSRHSSLSSSSFPLVSYLSSSWPAGGPTPPRAMLESIPEHPTSSGGDLDAGCSPSTAVSVGGSVTTPRVTTDASPFRTPAVPSTPRSGRRTRPRRTTLTPGTPYPPPSPILDPSLIQPFSTPSYHAPTPLPQVSEMPELQSPSAAPAHLPGSPISSGGSLGTPRPRSAAFRPASRSPYLQHRNVHPYGAYAAGMRRHSTSSGQAPASATRERFDSPPSAGVESDDDGKERGRCTFPDCGRVFRDLKAHLLTHQSERPEKCPITTCEYHHKGFARKYDKNRHTLTHYKGTMVCGFCPGSGSAAEKSFNRADVFKRHLTHVHNVEQTPPNSRKKSTAGSLTEAAVGSSNTSGYPADVTGKCSTCSGTFSSAQDFYEHLDECVLRIVQQGDPSEAINERNLASMDGDGEVAHTLQGHALRRESGALSPTREEAPPATTTTTKTEDATPVEGQQLQEQDQQQQQQQQHGEAFPAPSTSSSSTVNRSGRGMLRRATNPE
ncbi:MAG: hypothetical protein M1823_002026 [Watsoniomyces obsoletus]|nr:MAG: hypothetical protein M1823_002026 [Watsoniomyces obsoletus]